MTIPALFSVFDHAPQPLILVNADGMVLWTNQAAAKLCLSQKKPALADFFDPAAVRTILETSIYAELQLDPLSPLQPRNETIVVVIELGTSGPAEHLFLLALLPRTSRRGLLDEQEEFLALVMHDLKNPLGAIFGYADVLLDTGAGEGLSASHAKVLSRIRHTSARCLELVRNYQHLAQMKSSGISASPTPADLNFIVRFVIDYMWREAPGAPALTAELAEGELPTYIERVYVERVVANLLSNALKYSGEKGKVLLKTYKAGRFVVLELNNSGPAIPANELEMIFQRYARASNASGIPGTGLGLYIVKSIIDAAGGSVNVTSTPAQGTTFTVKFPLR